MRALEVSRALNSLQARMLDDSVGEKEFVEAREKVKADIEMLLGGAPLSGAGRARVNEPFFGDALLYGIEYDADGKPRPAGLVVDRELPIEDSNFAFPGLEPPVG